MNLPKISVILPVYNPGGGIVKCIESLRRQTLTDIEIIFVDDQGTDRSVERIREAAQQDGRVRLVSNPQNMGAGYSRNRGIALARGEYLSFIDPDDYVADDFLERLYRSTGENRPDIVKGEYEAIGMDGRVRDNNGYSQNDDIRKGLSQGKPLYALFRYAHWSAIYRRDFLLSSGARYGSTRNAQDTTFLLRACYFAKSIEFEDSAKYYYVAREDSRVRDYSARRLHSDLEAFQEKMDFLVPRFVERPGVYEYVCANIRYILQLETAVPESDRLTEEDGSFLETLRHYVLTLPFAAALEREDVIVDALLKYSVNLSVDPYGSRTDCIPYEHYRERVACWVEFIRAHPEYENKCEYLLKRVFENGICQARETISDSRQRQSAYRELRKLAKGLPETETLTHDYTSMKLFVAFGVNTFQLRNSSAGQLVKRLIALSRHLLQS